MWLQPISTLYNYSAYSLLVGKSVLLKHFFSCSVQFKFSVYNQNCQTLDCIPKEAIKSGFFWFQTVSWYRIYVLLLSKQSAIIPGGKLWLYKWKKWISFFYHKIYNVTPDFENVGYYFYNYLRVKKVESLSKYPEKFPTS